MPHQEGKAGPTAQVDRADGGRLRILHIIDGFEGHNFSDLLVSLAQRHQLYLVVLQRVLPEVREYLRTRDVEVLYGETYISRRRYPQFLPRLVRLLRRLEIDVIHGHLFDASALAIAAGTLGNTKLKVVTRHHGAVHENLGRPCHWKVDKLTGRWADLVIAVSNNTRSYLENKEGVEASKISVVGNGVDLERFRPLSFHERAYIRRRLAIEAGQVVIVPASLKPIKGHKYLLSAIAKVRHSLSERLHLLIAGDGPLRRELEEEVRLLGLEEAVQFLGWRRDVAQLVGASDATILPSLSETFGQVIIEAMAAGCPVIGTSVGGLPEIIEDGENGLLVESGSSDALREALSRVLTDKELRQRITAGGLRQAGEFEISRVASSHLQAYNRRLGRDEGT